MAKHAELLLLFILFISVGCYCGQPSEGESKLIIGRNMKVGRLDMDMDSESTPLLPATELNSHDGSISLLPSGDTNLSGTITEISRDDNESIVDLPSSDDDESYADVPDRFQIRSNRFRDFYKSINTPLYSDVPGNKEICEKEECYVENDEFCDYYHCGPCNTDLGRCTFIPPPAPPPTPSADETTEEDDPIV